MVEQTKTHKNAKKKHAKTQKHKNAKTTHSKHTLKREPNAIKREPKTNNTKAHMKLNISDLLNDNYLSRTTNRLIQTLNQYTAEQHAYAYRWRSISSNIRQYTVPVGFPGDRPGRKWP